MYATKHSRFHICFVKIEFKFMVFFYNFWASIEIDCTGTAISGLAFDYK